MTMKIPNVTILPCAMAFIIVAFVNCQSVTTNSRAVPYDVEQTWKQGRTVAAVEKFVHVSGLSDLADLCVLCQCPALGRDMNLRRTSFHNPMGLTNTHRVLDRIEAHPSIFLRRVGLTNTQRVLDCIEAHPSIFLRRVGLTDIQRAFDRIEAHPSIFLRRVGLPQWWQHHSAAPAAQVALPVQHPPSLPVPEPEHVHNPPSLPVPEPEDVHNPPSLPVPDPEPVPSVATATSDTGVTMGVEEPEHGGNAVDTNQLQPVDDVIGFDTLDTAGDEIVVNSSHTSDIIKHEALPKFP
ncbi:hypothetical protein ASPNIDRAFT_42280 [Aspergillus niger ATCC 1015]|uniref:Uncharacterized protein n=1 Tax=Aspergillus niger (strain ATCC 1015 / CBS 113.46 / FGSC A1144 / LSHB Ac4 / NCTC 3858a / NRRL 328 / USDA 3528.7) TaxID=380704 RepID=G3XVV9_ASPNA|nr:hypothetical protein ASPNIDRAFT_42280 [Aspergillus niger ATCC 1015]